MGDSTRAAICAILEHCDGQARKVQVGVTPQHSAKCSQCTISTHIYATEEEEWSIVEGDVGLGHFTSRQSQRSRQVKRSFQWSRQWACKWTCKWTCQRTRQWFNKGPLLKTLHSRRPPKPYVPFPSVRIIHHHRRAIRLRLPFTHFVPNYGPRKVLQTRSSDDHERPLVPP